MDLFLSRDGKCKSQVQSLASYMIKEAQTFSRVFFLAFNLQHAPVLHSHSSLLQNCFLVCF